LINQLDPLLDGTAVHLFGYSLGASIAHSLAQELERRKPRANIRSLIACACSASALDRHSIKGYSDDQFLEYIKSLGGLPPAVFTNPSLRDVALSILRDDFTLAETINLADASPISLPVVVLGGDDDPSVSAEGLEAWRTKTSGSMQKFTYSGDHFFFNQHTSDVFNLIKKHVLGHDPAR